MDLKNRSLEITKIRTFFLILQPVLNTCSIYAPPNFLIRAWTFLLNVRGYRAGWVYQQLSRVSNRLWQKKDTQDCARTRVAESCLFPSWGESAARKKKHPRDSTCRKRKGASLQILSFDCLATGQLLEPFETLVKLRKSDQTVRLLNMQFVY